MSPRTFAAMMIGFLPAILLMFLVFEKYEKYLNERKIFFSFAAGMIVGVVAGFFEMFNLFNLSSQYLDICIISIFGTAILHQGLKTVILNMGRFRDEGTSFYGVALGLGFGAVYAFMVAIRTLWFVSAQAIFFSVLTLLGFIALQGALGALIGYGCSIGRPFLYFGYASLLHLPLNTIIFAVWCVIIPTEVFSFISLIYGGGLFLYTSARVVPKPLPRKIRRELGV